jgi:ribosomal protein S4
MSVFKQKWTAKKELRSYHFPNIPIRQFLERHFDTHLPTQSLSRKDQELAPPAQALLFAKLERRLDVALFRGHLCRSLWAARRAVTTGNVKVNGVKVFFYFWGFLFVLFFYLIHD